MTVCSKEALISQHHDGELPEPKSQEVREHLQTCLSCARYQQSLTRLDQQITTLLKAPRDVVAPRRRRRPWTALFAAACVTTVALCFYTGLSTPRGLARPAPVSQHFTFETRKGQIYSVATQGDVELLSIEVDGTTTHFPTKEGRP